MKALFACFCYVYLFACANTMMRGTVLESKAKLSKDSLAVEKGTGKAGLSLFDLSNRFRDIVDEKGLKIVQQQDKPRQTEILFRTGCDRTLRLRIDQNDSDFTANLQEEDEKEIGSLTIANRQYHVQEFSDFITNQLNSLTPPDRKTVLEDSTGLTDFTNNILKKLDPNNELNIQWIVDPIADNLITVKLDELTKVFGVKLLDEDGVKLLVISNVPNEEDFQHFDSSHFEFRRQIIQSDTEETLDQYLDTIVTLLWEKIEFMVTTDTHMEQIYTLLKAHLESFDLRPLNEEALAGNEPFTIYVYEDAENDNKLAEIQITPLNETIYRLAVNRPEQDFNAYLIAGQFPDLMESISDELNRVLHEAINSNYTFSNLIEQFKALLKDHSCGDMTVISEDDKYNVFEYDFSENEDCSLKSSQLRGELFSYGYLQYFHITIENSLLLEEFMVSVNQSFGKNLKGLLVELLAEIYEIESHQEDEAQTIDFKEIKERLIELASDEFKCVDTGDSAECHKKSDTDKKDLVIIKKFIDENGEEFTKIILMNELKDDRTDADDLVNPEINIPSRNNSFQVERVVDKVKEFFENNSG